VNIRAQKAMPRQRARKSYIIRIAPKLLIVVIIEGFWVDVLDGKVMCVCLSQDGFVVVSPTSTFAYTPLQAL
jgi:hypothetical protein